MSWIIYYCITYVNSTGIARTLKASALSSLFVPKLISTIRHNNSFHLVYDVPVVADFSVLLSSQNADLDLSVEACLYIAACLVSAIEHLHR